RVPLALFDARMKSANASPMLGHITAFQRKLLKFDNDPVTDDRLSDGLVLVSFEKIAGQDRYGMIFRKVGDKWWIDDIPNMFPAERAGQGVPGGGGGGAPSAAPAKPTQVPSGPAGPPAPPK
ncbi:MAG TPA: hypothetical protein VLI90_19270, partial [Tepidisphaeraceae bacterium]|nr:hypothetical protein [Tepidisphaeraceae bacterium]